MIMCSYDNYIHIRGAVSRTRSSVTHCHCAVCDVQCRAKFKVRAFDLKKYIIYRK